MHKVYLIIVIILIELKELNYRGAADKRSLLTILSMYVGMICVVFLPNNDKKTSGYHELTNPELDVDIDIPVKASAATVNHKGVLAVACLDVVGQIVLTVGLFFVGSGLYQVIYSSIIVFAAIYNKCFLGRSMNYYQW